MGAYAIDSFADLGYRVMMDFGLAGLFDRLEREFGRNFAKFLLALISIAIIAGSFQIIGGVINPIIDWSIKTAFGSNLTWLAYQFLSIVFFGLYVVAGLLTITGIFELNTKLSEFDQITSEAKNISTDARVSLGIVQNITTKSKELHVEVCTLHDDLIILQKDYRSKLENSVVPDDLKYEIWLAKARISELEAKLRTSDRC